MIKIIIIEKPKIIIRLIQLLFISYTVSKINSLTKKYCSKLMLSTVLHGN
jgi:hypothetical protein